MNQQANSFFTDSSVTQTLLGIIAFLIVLAMGLIVYIWTEREKEYKAARIEEMSYHKTIDEKFTAINQFIVVQIEKNKNIERDISEIKRNPPPPLIPTPA